MKPLLRLGLGLLAIAVLVTTAAAQTSPVIPGQALAGFRLGQDLDVVVSSLGPLHSQSDMPVAALVGYYWPLRRIGVIADKTSHKVVALAISLDDTYKTDKGVAAGSEMAAVRRAYGREDSIDDRSDDQTLVYDKLGVAFVVDRGGPLGSRVTVIFVFAPGRYHDIFPEP